MRQFSATYMKALKDALAASFWYKNDLKDFIKSSVADQTLVDRFEWTNKDKKKRNILEELISLMVENESHHVSDINVLTRGVLEITQYRGFDRLEDKEYRLAEAARTKETLRNCFEEHTRNFNDKKKSIEFDYLKAEFERRKREDADRNRRRAEEDKQRDRDPAKYYGQVLGLKGKLTKEAIKNRHRELIKLYHPDRFSNLDEEFVVLANYRSQKINEAFEFMKMKYKI